MEILLTLFPSWLPRFFSVMFAKPFPEFSNKMNAWVTALTCQWLMGPNEVVDYERADGTMAEAQAVQVERCDPCQPDLPGSVYQLSRATPTASFSPSHPSI